MAEGPSMLKCRISITRYPSQPQFVHKYGIAITKFGDTEEVRYVDTDDELSTILQDVAGHTKQEVTDILEELGRNPKYGPYSRLVDENILVKWV